jgi:4-diphosphocytidyl-2-C-methyl-D-erythritol kinase
MSRRRSGLAVVAPAKVNLTLAVVGRRSDGYHALESVFARIGLYDDLVAEPLAAWEATDGARDELVVDGDTGYRATGDDLILRAAGLLRRESRAPLQPMRFRLTKRIPTAAGLGGGSSNAAAALVLGALAWDLELDQHALLRLAERLGSDVPFFASTVRIALVRGRGETVMALGVPAAPLGVLSVTPRERLPTAHVFSALGMLRDRPASNARRVTGKLADLVATGASPAAIVALAPELREANDLWPAALRVLPALAELRYELEQTLMVPFLMSGSGPTLIALYPAPGDAQSAADRLRAALPPTVQDAAIHAVELPTKR